MKVLVTGSTGFLGRHIVQRLLSEGHDLCCLVRSLARAIDIQQRGVELACGDLTNPTNVIQAAEGMEAVVHAAGQLGGWGSEDEFFRNNLEATQNLVEACRLAGIRSVVSVSSVAVYGRQPDRYLPEDSDIRAESDPYCRTKLAGELALREYAETSGAAVTVVRPSIIYGAFDTHFSRPVVRRLRKSLVAVVGHRDHGLPLVYAGDVARFVALRLRGPESGFNTFNLSSPEKVTWSDIAAAVSRFHGRGPALVHLPYRLAYSIGAVMEGAAKLVRSSHAPMLTRFIAVLLGRQYYFDSAKALTVPGFDSFTPFDVAFKESLEWIGVGQE